MAEVVTMIIALPILHPIGGFYYRLGAGLCRALVEWRAGGASDRTINT